MVTNFMGNSRLCCFARFDSRVFFTFFKSNKWYQIAQSVLFDFSMVQCWIGIGMHSLDYELLIGEVQSQYNLFKFWYYFYGADLVQSHSKQVMTPETVEEELDKAMLEYLQNQIVIDDEKQEVRAVQSFQVLTFTVKFSNILFLFLFKILSVQVM